MTDYHPLIARAVAGLAKSTGENRRALYDRARSALLAQLRNLDPPLAENEITRERLLLEEAIRKVETDAARQQRSETPRATPPRPAEPASREARPGAADRPAAPERAPATVAPKPAAGESGAAKIPAGGAQRAGQYRSEERERSEQAAAQALKGFRDLIAEVAGEPAPSAGEPEPPQLAEAESRAPRFSRPIERFETIRPPQGPPKPRRQSRSAPPPDDLEIDGLEPRRQPRGISPPAELDTEFEPRIEPIAQRSARREAPPAEDESYERIEVASPPQRPTKHARFPEPPEERRRGRSGKALAAAFLGVTIVVGIALAFYWQRDRVRSIFARGPVTQVQREATPSRPKISDRVGQAGQAGQQSAPAATPDTKEGAPIPAVAQRVVLYEEDPADAQGKRYVGTVVWRTEMVSPGAGQPPELAIKGDLEIQERRISMTMSVRRNSDKALPASHTIEIMFNLPADFPFGGISNVPGILMKQAEQTRGSPLAGLAVKVTSGFFLIGLSSTNGDMQRNLELLKERPWFDIPIVYNNGRRAILAIEKGTPGERAFKEAFAAWGE